VAVPAGLGVDAAPGYPVGVTITSDASSLYHVESTIRA
jgi:hypothetical protein